ncbi:MAG: deoxyribonuclease IV [Calditrichaceae bacterium]
MLIGCHVSISGGISSSVIRALNIGCETFQIFTQNQQQWINRIYTTNERDGFKHERIKYAYNHVPLMSHASYLINMCSKNEITLKKSRQALKDEIIRCDSLGIDLLVIHPGAHGGKGVDWGIDTIAETINLTLDGMRPDVTILLETTAGQGTGIGHRFEHLKSIIDQVDKDEKVGVCLDTCHIFAAGYDMGTEQDWDRVIDEYDKIVGLKKLKAFHLNDSLREVGSRVDRHAQIGKGEIGIESFKYIVNNKKMKDIPAVIEIPGDENVYRDTVIKLKNLRK